MRRPARPDQRPVTAWRQVPIQPCWGHWPGGVRQLQNVIFRAAAICESSLVDIGDLDIAGTSVARQSDE